MKKMKRAFIGAMLIALEVCSAQATEAKGLEINEFHHEHQQNSEREVQAVEKASTVEDKLQDVETVTQTDLQTMKNEMADLKTSLLEEKMTSLEFDDSNDREFNEKKSLRKRKLLQAQLKQQRRALKHSLRRLTWEKKNDYISPIY